MFIWQWVVGRVFGRVMRIGEVMGDSGSFAN